VTNKLPDNIELEDAIRHAGDLAHAGALAAKGLEELCAGDSAALETLLEKVEEQISIIKTWFYEVYSTPSEKVEATS
jgi:hypothetical protein